MGLGSRSAGHVVGNLCRSGVPGNRGGCRLVVIIVAGLLTFRLLALPVDGTLRR
jgi:hypothetical protein